MALFASYFRGQRVKIFDFKNRFLPLFFQYLKVQSEGDQKVLLDPFPEPDVMLSFGQRWGDKRPIENTLIWAKVSTLLEETIIPLLILLSHPDLVIVLIFF